MKNFERSTQNRRSASPNRTWFIRYEDADGKPCQEIGFLTQEEAVRRLHEVGQQIDNQIRQKHGEAEGSERA